jgi:hypothetical protein
MKNWLFGVDGCCQQLRFGDEILQLELMLDLDYAQA